MSRFFAPLTAPERRHAWVFAGAILLLHLVGWGVMLVVVAPRYPFMVGFAGLAYSFGLRHAFDADHIAAIDNTTRKLMQGETRPLGVGFFFSLGHSTVVFALTLAVALAARLVTTELPHLRELGSLIGTTVSGLFLCAIGLVNLAMLVDVFRVFVGLQRQGVDHQVLEAQLATPGWLTRWFGGVFRIVTRPRHMYWVGLLFGLGFDTATEVALLTTAGLAASQALPLAAVLMLPIVFAAGMTLTDTADGFIMCGAYGWATAHPLRKLFYNLTVTGLSVVIALAVGGIELVSVVTGRMLGIHSGVWGTIQAIDFQTLGYIVVALFIGAWMTSIAVWRLGGWATASEPIARD
jgi:high-affinity nickel-transport protein